MLVLISELIQTSLGKELFGCFQRPVKASGHAFELKRRSSFRKRNAALRMNDKMQTSRAFLKIKDIGNICSKPNTCLKSEIKTVDLVLYPDLFLCSTTNMGV